MTNAMQSAMTNGRGWYQEIRQLVERLEIAEEQDRNGGADETYAPRREIEEGPLSVMVRDGWRQPDAAAEDGPEEYEILLSTGGPALRIYGTLSYGEPDDAELQAQDWGTQWTRVPDTEEKPLLAYARCFYFGE